MIMTISEITEKLRQLEVRSSLLEPNQPERDKWSAPVFQYADDFLTSVHEKKTYVVPEDVETLSDFKIEEEGKSVGEVIGILQKEVDTPGINPASGGHLGYIPGGGIYTTALGDYLASVFNRYSGIFFANPGAVRMENMLIRWMNRLIGYPDSAFGNLTSGGSVANLIAIVSARDAMDIKANKVATSCVYLTGQIHHSILKALRIAGLAEIQVRLIPMNNLFQLDVKALRQQVDDDLAEGLSPFMVVASAGTTDTGSIDDLQNIGEFAIAHHLWFHVDAAYGGFFMLVKSEHDKFRGIELSDSVSIDPHKGLFLAYGSGAVLIKNKEQMLRSHVYRANYMQDAYFTEQEPSPADLSPELTKHFRGMRMWLSLQLHGLKPFRACLEEKLWLCRYFYHKVAALGFEVGPEPDLSVCIYRYTTNENDDNQLNAWLVEKIQEDGRVFISSTTIEGVFWLRLAVLSFRTHRKHVDILLEILQREVGNLISSRKEKSY